MMDKGRLIITPEQLRKLCEAIDAITQTIVQFADYVAENVNAVAQNINAIAEMIAEAAEETLREKPKRWKRVTNTIPRWRCVIKRVIPKARSCC